MHVSGLVLCLNYNPKSDYTYQKGPISDFCVLLYRSGKQKGRENVYGRSFGTDRFCVLSGEE